VSLTIPNSLAASCRGSPERTAWLGRLPDLVDDLRRRWSLTLGAPFDGPEVSAAWAAPANLADGTPAVLKVLMPHMEADHEIDGLWFWDGIRRFGSWRPTIPLVRCSSSAACRVRGCGCFPRSSRTW
jgi:hypothetical protein